MVFLGERRHRAPACHSVLPGVQDCCGDLPAIQRVLAHPTQVPPRKGLPKFCGDLTFFAKLLRRYFCPLHHITDQPLHIHNRRNKQRFFNRCPGKSQHGKIGPDAVGPQPNSLPVLLQIGQHRLQLRHHLPGSKAGFPRAVSMFRQVNAQHLPAGWGGKRRKCCGFRFITALAMHEQPDVGGRFAVQYSRNCANF